LLLKERLRDLLCLIGKVAECLDGRIEADDRSRLQGDGLIF
jgi:hypothetical protein